MRQYRKSIGSLKYDTYNVPGAAETSVSIENHKHRYLFNPTYKEWSKIHDFAGKPKLPAKQLAELEAALLEHTERRRKWFSDCNEWNRHIARILKNKDNVSEVSTIYEGSFYIDGVEAPKVGIEHSYNRDGTSGGWLSYTIPHGPDQIKVVRRRVPSVGEKDSPEARQIWKQLEAEMEEQRAADEGTALGRGEAKKSGASAQSETQVKGKEGSK